VHQSSTRQEETAGHEEEATNEEDAQVAHEEQGTNEEEVADEEEEEEEEEVTNVHPEELSCRKLVSRFLQRFCLGPEGSFTWTHLAAFPPPLQQRRALASDGIGRRA